MAEKIAVKSVQIVIIQFLCPTLIIHIHLASVKLLNVYVYEPICSLVLTGCMLTAKSEILFPH